MALTRTVAAIVAVVALGVHLAAGAAHGQSFDDDALRHDAESLLTMDAARRLFDAEELWTLRTSLRSTPAESIDRLLAAKAAIEVTINPEARVSISRTPAALPRLTCGTAEPLLIRIANQGRVRSALNVRLLGEVAPTMVGLEPLAPHLAGAGVEYRVLMITVNTDRAVDLTLVVDAGPGTDDLALRSQLPVLVQCSPPKSAAAQLHALVLRQRIMIQDSNAAQLAGEASANEIVAS